MNILKSVAAYLVLVGFGTLAVLGAAYTVLLVLHVLP